MGNIAPGFFFRSFITPLATELSQSIHRCKIIPPHRHNLTGDALRHPHFNYSRREESQMDASSARTFLKNASATRGIFLGALYATLPLPMILTNE